MERGLEAASITEGRVFRAVLRGGRVQGSLTPESLSKAVKKLAARVGLDPKTVGAHSLRAGFVSTCVETNAPLIKVAEVIRHKSLSMLQVDNWRSRLHPGSS
jgi:site-specific recombinase XerD